MTRKLEDLRDFVIEIRKAKVADGDLSKRISMKELIKPIGERFGTSKFQRKSVMEELGTFGLIFETDIPEVFSFEKEEPAPDIEKFK